MADRVKVMLAKIEAVQEFILSGSQEVDDAVDAIRMLADLYKAIAEEEPVAMKPSYFNYVCSGCGSEIDGEFIEYTGGKIKFCPWCGREVKWE